MKRRLDHERAESDRLSGEAASDRLRARQLEREGDQLRNDLEEYRSGIISFFLIEKTSLYDKKLLTYYIFPLIPSLYDCAYILLKISALQKV